MVIFMMDVAKHVDIQEHLQYIFLLNKPEFSFTLIYHDNFVDRCYTILILEI